MLTRLFGRPTRPARLPAGPAARLRLEPLEDREVPSVTLANILNQQTPLDRPIYVPVTVTNTPAAAVAYTATSSNASPQVEQVAGGRSVRLNVSGGTGAGAFSGTLTLRLFENAAPLATQRIIDLVNNGFYTGKTFHRIIDNFVIQGGSPNGDGLGGSTLPDLPDEFSRDFTFASSGLLAMANAGDDNNNSQFFITDTKTPLAGRPEHLNFNHTIAGILTEGFDLYQKIITTSVNGQSPLSPVTITSAEVFTDTENAVLKLTPKAGFSGTSDVTVTGDDGSGSAASTKFVATATVDTANSRPFLGTIPASLTTTTNAGTTFILTSTDLEGDAVQYAVKDVTFAGAPANVSVSINQATGQVTLTPAAGFTGTINLKAGVRAASAADSKENYDTQSFSLTVNAPVVTPVPPVPPVTPPVTPVPPVPPVPPVTPTGPLSVANVAAGQEPRVSVKYADGTEKLNFLAYEASFTGGVTATLADVTGDGVQDVVVVPGAGGAPLVKVYSSADGTLLYQLEIFETTFRGGLNMRVADVTGDNVPDIVVGAGNTGGPRVSVINAKTQAVTQNFFAGDSSFRGGVFVDAAVLQTGKTPQIVTGAGVGGGPLVGVYDPTTGKAVTQFYAGDEATREGAKIRLGDLPPPTTANAIEVRPLFVAPADGPGAELPVDLTPHLTLASLLK